MEYGFILGLVIGTPVGIVFGLIATYWWAKKKIIETQTAVVSSVTTNSRQIAKSILASFITKKASNGLRNQSN